MKKTLLVLLLVTLIFGSVFAEELYSRENVNTVWLDSIQNGEYIYVANLVSKSENEITVLIDIFNGIVVFVPRRISIETIINSSFNFK